MDSPLTCQITRLWTAVLGRRRSDALVACFYRSLLMSRKHRDREFRVFARILTHLGQRPNAATLEGLVRELASIYGDYMLTLHLLAPGRPLPGTIELPLSRIRELQSLGRGLIIASPHFGNAALAMPALGLAAGPITTLLIDAAWYQWLASFNLRPISVGDSAAALTRALVNGEMVWMTPDIDFFPDNRLSPFFGAQVRPPHGPARLAISADAPLLPAYPVRGERGWRLELDEPIFPKGQTQEALEWELLRSMERFIGRYPSHWWTFRDLWDVEATDRDNRTLLQEVKKRKEIRARYGEGAL